MAALWNPDEASQAASLFLSTSLFFFFRALWRRPQPTSAVQISAALEPKFEYKDTHLSRRGRDEAAALELEKAAMSNLLWVPHLVPQPFPLVVHNNRIPVPATTGRMRSRKRVRHKC